MAELNKKFIVNLKGKDFVEYGGLIDLAHQLKLKSIKTDIIQFPNKENNNQCIVKAIITTEDEKVFEGYGDADPSNVNSMIARHLIRMSETRAKARALRDLTNVGMTAIEELGGDDDTTPTTSKYKPNVAQGTLSENQIKRLYAIAGSKKVDAGTVKIHVKSKFNKEVSELTKVEYDIVCKGYEGMETGD